MKQELERWLIDEGLYSPTLIDMSNVMRFAGNLYKEGLQLDCYCPGCRRESVFRWQPNEQFVIMPLRPMATGAPPAAKAFEYVARVMAWMQFDCARDPIHQLLFLVRTQQSQAPLAIQFTKIGQYPSHFDLASAQLARYAKIVSPLDIKELKSAETCCSHGYHIAAFTYLRRVFERRLEVAHQAAKSDATWDETAYDARGRMDERIQALRDHLPRFLVENKKLYGVLSKGLHELTEEECHDAYDTAHLGVTLILDEEIERRDRKAKITAASKSVQELQKKYGQGKEGT
jgi:hypothetical protein